MRFWVGENYDLGAVSDNKKAYGVCRYQMVPVPWTPLRLHWIWRGCRHVVSWSNLWPDDEL